MSGRRVSPIARAREEVAKGQRRKSPEARVSPIARARISRKSVEKREAAAAAAAAAHPEVDDEDLPPLSVPFGMECFLTHAEIQTAMKFIKKNFPRKGDKPESFQIYTIDYDEEEALADPAKEYESVLVFHWFRPAAGVNITDIADVWARKRGKWHEFLWACGLMPEGSILKEVECPEMLDPVEEEDDQ